MRSSSLNVLLIVLLVLSLALNFFTLLALVRYRDNTLAAVAGLRQALQALGQTPVTTVVHVEQDIPVEGQVPLNATFDVPVDTQIPFSTTVYTTLNLPLLGAQKIPVPIEGNLPLQVTLKMPVHTTLPVSTVYHLVTDLPVQVTLTPENLQPLDKALQVLADGLQ